MNLPFPAAGAPPGRTDAGIPKLSLPADWTELFPELGQHHGDHIVRKQRSGAFIGTSLDDYLRQRGVTQVFLTGISTSSFAIGKVNIPIRRGVLQCC
jgi:nicotinamidase-related amidase